MFVLHGNLHHQPFEALHKQNVFYDVDALLLKSKRVANGMFSEPFDWSSFVFVLHPSTQFVYFFSGMDAENRENNARRVKEGVQNFINRGYDVYEVS